MVKRNIIVCLGMFVVTSGCKKEGNNSNASNAIWTVGSIQYTATTIKKQGNAFIAATGLNSMQIFFVSPPTRTRNYKIADQNKVNNNTLDTNEVGVLYNIESTDMYLSTGSANDSATVSIQGGVLTIKVLTTPVQHYAGGPALDLNTASGVLKTDKY